ncbi:hypothetical protein K402DRAFT_390370 [Aulographum hederae CBS 113979]|uniref:Uncharacterized protein n=1 Tax=Aulographum hederae CBS 113979 TaxID=1176131 RepID=A0A6G1HA02_9PEZI|nr:hypothetical protein K402DRAFT_390370 [Aulographum hederae CBS 113979]
MVVPSHANGVTNGVSNGVPASPRSLNGSANGIKKRPQSMAASAPGTMNGAVNGAMAHLSPYEIMASRIMNRVGEMAENLTFAEKPKPYQEIPGLPQTNGGGKRKPRKLELRLQNSSADAVSFSAPFLDNTLSKMLDLQTRMLKTGANLARSGDVSEEVKKEQFAQSAELSRIIALICAEKARQGA